MYKLLKMTFGEPVQILEEDTELMSIKFYSQTLWTTLNVSLLDKKLGEAFIFSLCKGESRPGPRSTTQRPSSRPPNQRQPTGPPFLSINRKTWQSLANRPDGPETDPEQRPFSDLPLLELLVNQRCPLFWVRCFFFLIPRVP